jgi:SAM-dependent methyltransferase
VTARVVAGLREPVSDRHGFDRGTPTDRPYIEAHLAAHAADVRGRVLEVKEALYATRVGGARVAHVDVVDVDPTNPHADLVADLDEEGALEASAYDCVILTQVLEFLRPHRALPQLYRALAPGGVLLMTVPFVCRLEAPTGDRWRISPDGLRQLLDEVLPPSAECTVSGRGNLTAALALLAGLSAEECGRPQDRPDDWRFPVVTLARVRKPLP